MALIEFIGIRGGHGTTTAALAAAATLATRGPTTISTHDRRALCATVGIAADGLPMPVAENLELTEGDDADVIDGGTLDPQLTDDHLGGKCRNAPGARTAVLHIGVLRGPDYLGMRTLCEHSEAVLDGVVVFSEPDRALDARDVEHVTGREVVAVVDQSPGVARIIDAGLFMSRVTRLREFTQLRDWITEIVTQETPCSALT